VAQNSFLVAAANKIKEKRRDLRRKKNGELSKI